jgi:hypothetical protein
MESKALTALCPAGAKPVEKVGLKSPGEVFKDLARPPFKPLMQTHTIHELSGVCPGKQLPAASESHSVYTYFENEPFNRTLLESNRFLMHGWYCTLL